MNDERRRFAWEKKHKKKDASIHLHKAKESMARLCFSGLGIRAGYKIWSNGPGKYSKRD
jgi:hypothetical protein